GGHGGTPADPRVRLRERAGKATLWSGGRSEETGRPRLRSPARRAPLSAAQARRGDRARARRRPPAPGNVDRIRVPLLPPGPGREGPPGGRDPRGGEAARAPEREPLHAPGPPLQRAAKI